MEKILFYSITARNGEDVHLRKTENGGYACPICGALNITPPYDPKTMAPSFAWCVCCEFQWGWDDTIPPESPTGTQEDKWDELREEWLQSGVPANEAESQLRILQISKEAEEED